MTSSRWMQARLSATLNSVPGFPAARGFYDRDRRVAGSVLAAGVAFRLFLTVLPLSFLAAAAIGFMKPSGVGSPIDVARRAGLTASLAITINQSATDARDARWALLALGLVLLLWASVGVYRSLLMVHTVTWNLAPLRGRPPLRNLAVVSGGVVLLAIVPTIPNALRILDPTFVAPARVLSVVLYTGIWLLITWYLPHRPASWPSLLPGALVFGLGLEFLQLLMVFVGAPRMERATRLYGAIGIASVTLASLLLVGRLVLASAHLNVVLWERQQRDGALGRAARRDTRRQSN